MSKCKKVNYSKERFSESINLAKVEGSNIDELVKNIYKMLEGTLIPFSISYSNSLDTEAYEDSINELVDTIKDKINSLIEKTDKEFIKKLTPAQKGLITKGLKELLLPKPLTEAELFIQAAVIPEADLATTEELQRIKYNSLVNYIYDGIGFAYDAWRLNNFKKDLYGCSIINAQSGTIINNNFELNSNIILYLQLQYKIIYDYLNTFVFKGQMPVRLFPKTYYTANPTDTAVKIPTKNCRNLFLAMYNHIKALKLSDAFKNMLADGYTEEIDTPNKISESKALFRAVNAYANLRFFDLTLKVTLGKMISINRVLGIPISSITDEMGDTHRVFKYIMEVGNSNAIKTWGATENADATKLVSSFNKFIIEQIPIYDYTTKEKLYNTLQLKDFLTAFTKLKEIGMSISSTKLDFSTWCKQLTSDTSFSDGYLSKIFKALFNSQNNVLLLKKLQEMGLNKNDLNTLYSVYRTAFKSTTTNGEKSWYLIELNFALNTGLRSRYNLVENLYNLICSNEALNYLLTIYNYDTKEYETKIKERFSVDKFKFNLKTYANRNNYKREDKAKLIKDYSFTESADKLHYSFSVGGVTYNVHITSNDVNLLSKKHPSSKYEITATYIEDGQTITLDISKVFFGDHAILQVELKEANKRKAIIEDTGSPFMQLLSFVNNMLLSNFGNTPESLSELYFAMQHLSSFLRDLVLSATRGLLVCNIYNKLEKAISENEENKNKYSKCHIDTYLKDIKEYPGIISSEDTAEYYEKNSLGQYLSTIHPNETWVDTLAKANAIVNNNTSLSVTSDLEGNHVPNVSPAYLSASNSIKLLMEMSSMNGKASGYLLFSENNNALEIATVNLDIQSSLFKPKSLKNFTCSELFLDAILNKFIYPLVNGGKIYILSTTQSDKTKFIANRVNLKNIKVDLKTLFEYCKSPLELRSKICEMLRNTIGKAYQQVLSEVLLDYQKIFPLIKTITDLNNLLKTYTEKSLLAEVTKYNETSNNPITLYKDLHYRNVNGGLAINELLDEFANNLYTKNNDRLERRLLLEEVRFLNNLTKNMFSIELTDLLRTAMRKLNININEWTKTITDKSEDEQNPKSTTYLILAKLNNKNILMGKVDETIPVTLNPLLETYFLTDNLIGNNIRFGTTGTEINHKIKALSKINLRKELNKQTNSPEFANAVFGPDTNITFHDLKNAIEINKNIPEVYTLLSDLYNRLIYKLENLGQNALFKRNVIMSATMTKMIPSLNGISKDMNIAVIYDMPATVFNFSGEQTEIDAHDGSALISPLWSILENKSLGSNEVGSVKKPIHHFYDDRYMTATLLKYATDAMTNNWMRQSVGNDLNGTGHAVNLYKMFKKMHHKRWTDNNGNWIYGPIDLINGCGFKEGGDIDFNSDILEGHELFYNNLGTHYKICDFGKSKEGIYYTLEERYDPNHVSSGVLTKVYHYFNENGDHITSEKILEDTEYHTIDSLFELHSALGGLWSESWNGKSFNYSESSNIATVNFINNVCSVNKEGEQWLQKNKKKDIPPAELKYYDLPLKRAMIHMIANNSAVKNGAGNINSNSSWLDNTELSYMTISTKHYGIQLDSDHTADEAHMTEFSQVISSLDAGGYLHEYVSLIYEQLGETALLLSEVELNTIKEFRESKNKSILYDLIGRTIINNLLSGQRNASLASTLLGKIKKRFNINSDHTLDKLKIPFSDPSIYSQILPTFVSNINSKSIKRQYPGLGTVMVPSYNMSMIYDFGGHPMQFADVLKEAQMKGLKYSNPDITKANLEIVKLYLLSILDKVKESLIGDFIPTDNVLVTLNNDKSTAEHFSLNSITGYYNFTDNPQFALAEKKYNTKIEQVLAYNKNGSPAKNIKYQISVGNLKYFVLKHLNGNLWIMELDTNGLLEEDKKKLFGTLQIILPKEAVLITSSIHNLDQGLELNDYGFLLVNEANKVNLLYGNIEENLKIWKNTNTIQFYKDITVPRNLAPSRIEFDYIIDPKNKTAVHTNIFNSYVVKNKILEIQKISNSKELNKELKKLQLAEIEKKYDVEKVFRDLKEGKFLLENGVMVDVVEGSLKNQAAEIIMSNIYATTFGIKEGDSLYDVLKLGADYFETPEITLDSTNYDLVFTKNTGNHTFITFKPFLKNTNDYNTEYLEWDDTIVEKNDSISKLASDSPRVINKVYATTKDHVKLFLIGALVITNKVKWDSKLKAFVDLQGKKVKNAEKYIRYKDKVLEYIEFISKHNAVEKTRDNNYINFELYNINRSNIARALEYEEYSKPTVIKGEDGKEITLTEQQNRNSNINKFISNLLTKLYQADSYSGVSLNNKLTSLTIKVLKHTLKGFGNNLSYDEKLQKYIMGLPDVFKQFKRIEGDNFECKNIFIKNKFNKYLRDIKERLYTSFLRSLDFTVSRIPALTLLSFMKMKNVGFSGVKTGQCYVTAWLTWLLGSDYDIDKAYIMGLSFDANGKYLGWSNLFDYTNYKTLEASEKLPMPKGVTYKRIENTDKAITELLEAIALEEDSYRKELLQKELQSLDDVVDIDEYLEEISNTKTAEARISKEAKLLNYLYKHIHKGNKNQFVNIKYSHLQAVDIMKDLYKHENTNIPKKQAVEVSKNFISSHIQYTIQDLSNMVRAYSPIDMEVFREASNYSDKGNESEMLTMLNPTCKQIMQYQNMIGKNVIGIAANGEKGSFMWHYYLNDIIMHGSPDEIALAKFEFKTDRLVGRAAFKQGKGNLLTGHIVSALPDMNFENLSPERKAEMQKIFSLRISGNLYVDLMISLVLSAATD